MRLTNLSHFPKYAIWYIASRILSGSTWNGASLAMSSRNIYLTPDERNIAPVLRKSLQIGESMIKLGERDSQKIVKEIKRKIKETNSEIDYVEIVDPHTLLRKERVSDDVLIAAAIYIGKTRLIDNIIVEVKNVS